MKTIDVKIKNLGKIKEGLIKIRPITLLAGKNGTGKTFVTKTLYSIFNVINKNVYHVSVIGTITKFKSLLKAFITNISHVSTQDHFVIGELDDMLSTLSDRLKIASNDLNLIDYFSYAISLSDAEEIASSLDGYKKNLEGKPTKLKSINRLFNNIIQVNEELKNKLKNPRTEYLTLLTNSLSKEIKENFQISDTSTLISFDEKAMSLDIEGFLHIKLENQDIEFGVHTDFIDWASSLSRVVFFESPAYWKVRNALKSAKDRNDSLEKVLGNRKAERLIGVPKYFYDLDNALTEKLITNNSSTTIADLTKNLASALGGEFKFNGDDLVFSDQATGKEINPNLISFGMTNLGMIHALLKNNVITHGSFVFIDEPETNLHPEWQVLLTDTLIALAERDIKVVMATHSIDMVKALEVGLQNKGVENFLSVHYFDTDGTLLEFDAKNPLEQLKEVREELSAPYQKLFFAGCYED